MPESDNKKLVAEHESQKKTPIHFADLVKQELQSVQDAYYQKAYELQAARRIAKEFQAMQNHVHGLVVGSFLYFAKKDEGEKNMLKNKLLRDLASDDLYSFWQAIHLMANDNPVIDSDNLRNRFAQSAAETKKYPKSSLCTLTPEELWIYFVQPGEVGPKTRSKEEDDAEKLEAVAWGENNGIAWGRELEINWEKGVSIDWNEYPRTAKAMQVCLARGDIAKKLSKGTTLHPENVTKAMARSPIEKALGKIAGAFSGGPKDKVPAKISDELLTLHHSFLELENLKEYGEKLLRHASGQKLGLEVMARYRAILRIIGDILPKLELSLDLQGSSVDLSSTQELLLASAVGGVGPTNELTEKIAYEEEEIKALLDAANEVMEEDLKNGRKNGI